jgi:hypothetical protein
MIEAGIVSSGMGAVGYDCAKKAAAELTRD